MENPDEIKHKAKICKANKIDKEDLKMIEIIYSYCKKLFHSGRHSKIRRDLNIGERMKRYLDNLRLKRERKNLIKPWAMWIMRNVWT